MALPNWYRKCVGCGKENHKKEMLRIAKTKTAQPQIDLKQTKPGRGAYLCYNAECASLAEMNMGLEKSLRCKIENSIYRELINQVKKSEH
ncbi:hypothetical protein B6I21_09395 [candidate division KSB1 bacterium 4572_119]|nr:MAG: hypothetical protein B6I21_09395 [candidate division KSB1 bacterium 4572_119]